jgi:hypothetical protein
MTDHSYEFLKALLTLVGIAYLSFLIVPSLFSIGLGLAKMFDRLFRN